MKMINAFNVWLTVALNYEETELHPESFKY